MLVCPFDGQAFWSRLKCLNTVRNAEICKWILKWTGEPSEWSCMYVWVVFKEGGQWESRKVCICAHLHDPYASYGMYAFFVKVCSGLLYIHICNYNFADIMQYPKVSSGRFGIKFLLPLSICLKRGIWRFQDGIQERSQILCFFRRHYKCAITQWHPMWHPNTYTQLCASQHTKILMPPICFCHLHLTLAAGQTLSTCVACRWRAAVCRCLTRTHRTNEPLPSQWESFTVYGCSCVWEMKQTQQNVCVIVCVHTPPPPFSLDLTLFLQSSRRASGHYGKTSHRLCFTH